MSFPVDVKNIPISENKIRNVQVFSACTKEFTPAALATWIFSLTPNGFSTEARLRRISVSALADVAATINVFMHFSGASSTAGIACTSAQHHYNAIQLNTRVFPTSTCSALFWNSSSPSPQPSGTLSGVQVIRQGRLTFGTSTTQCVPLTWSFDNSYGYGPSLKDNVSAIILNLNGQTLPAGARLIVDVEWEEARLPRVSMVGDSTYATSGMTTVMGISGYLTSMCVLDNLGANGNTMSDYINGTGGNPYPQSQVVPNRSQDVLVVGYGINDVRTGATTREQLISRINSIINTTLASSTASPGSPDCKIILHGPNSLTTDNFGGNNYVTLTGLFSGMTMPQASQEATNIMYDAYESFRGDPRIFALVQRQDLPQIGRVCKTVAESGYMTDQLHPNLRGVTVEGRQLTLFIIEAVKARTKEIYQ